MSSIPGSEMEAAITGVSVEEHLTFRELLEKPAINRETKMHAEEKKQQHLPR